MMAGIATTTNLPSREKGGVVAVPGGILQHRGTIYPITQFVDIKYSLEPLQTFLKTIHNQLYVVDALAHDITLDKNMTQLQHDILTDSLIRLTSEMHSFINPPTISTGRTNRARRGLFNFVGVVSNTLFGTIDEATFNGRLSDYEHKLKYVT